MKPRLLDLFCGAGGCSKGYAQAGFEVVGVDIKPQPNYPFEFIEGDALELLDAMLPTSGMLNSFDAIHASPPCQAHSAMQAMWNAKEHEDLVGVTREMLKQTGLPYVIENVEGAPLENPVTLCGTAFGLGVGDATLRRHRLFECSFPVMVHPCQHRGSVIGVYGGHARNRTRTIGVGKGARDSRRKSDRGVADFTADEARVAMGIDWMSITELSQAIPPAYTQHIGDYLIRELRTHDTERSGRLSTSESSPKGALGAAASLGVVRCVGKKAA